MLDTERTNRRLAKALVMIDQGVQADGRNGSIVFTESFNPGLQLLSSLMPPESADMLWRQKIWEQKIVPELVKIAKSMPS